MRGRRGDRMAINIREHMAINVCPGPIRPIRQISDYFPRRAAGPEAGGRGSGEAPAGLAPLALAPPAALLGATTPEDGAEVDSYDSDDTSESGLAEPGCPGGWGGWREGRCGLSPNSQSFCGDAQPPTQPSPRGPRRCPDTQRAWAPAWAPVWAPLGLPSPSRSGHAGVRPSLRPGLLHAAL